MEDLKASGSCVCGKVHVSVQGKPIGAVYCHCSECQRSHSAPFYQAVTFPVPQVEYTFPQGGDFEENIIKVHVTENGPHRYTCRSCGTRMGNRPVREGGPSFIAVPAPVLQRNKPLPPEYKPTLHLFYSERSVNVKDGLPKYARFPAAWGGSDETVAEE